MSTTLRTSYEDIVNVNYVGKEENPIDKNELLMKAGQENLTRIKAMTTQVCVIGIDIQNDFMDGGSLGVPGACEDVKRFTKFIYDNMDGISKIVASIDTHIPHQIFSPSWWIDENGDNVKPYTLISLADLDAGKYRAIIKPVESREYVQHLEQVGKKQLVVWPYHCIQGTHGCALEGQFSNMIYFWEVAKKSIPEIVVKGTTPVSEMYGILKGEGPNQPINVDLLNKIEKYDMIVIAGEAKSHCCLESIRQMLEHYYQTNPEVTSKIHILTDCMSSIPGYEADTEATFDMFRKKYNVVLTTSDALKLV